MPPSLRDNPVYCLEHRRFRRLFPVAGEAFDRWGPTGIWVWVRLALWALLAAPPYVMSARLAGEAFASTGSLLMLAVAAFGGGLWLLPAASGRLTGERDRRTLDSLLLTRMSAAEIVWGKAGALLAQNLVLFTTVCAIWILVPPVTAGADLIIFRIGQDPRALMACLWLDGTAFAVTCAFTGMAISAWCRSSRRAVLAGVGVSLFFLLPGAIWVAQESVAWLTLAAPVTIGWEPHAVLWAGCVLLAPIVFLLAQIGISPAGVPLRTPWGRPLPVRATRRVTRTLVALLLVFPVGVAALAVVQAAAVCRVVALVRVPPRVAACLSQAARLSLRDGLRLLDSRCPADLRGKSAALVWGRRAALYWNLHDPARATAATIREMEAWEEVQRQVASPLYRVEALEGVALCRWALDDFEGECRYLRLAVKSAQDALRSDNPLLRMLRQDFTKSIAGHALFLERASDRDGAIDAWQSLLHSGGTTQRDASEHLAILRERLYEASCLGIDLDTRGGQCMVMSVSPEAGRAGVGVGDQLVGLDGRAVRDSVDALRLLARHKPGDVVPVTLARGKQGRKVVRVRLTPGPHVLAMDRVDHL